MDINRICLRYYPPGEYRLGRITRKNTQIQKKFVHPGIGICYTENTQQFIREIDCLDLSKRLIYIFFNSARALLIFHSTQSNDSSDIERYAHDIINNDPLLPNDLLPDVKSSLEKLKAKLHEPSRCKFYHFKTLKANLLPMTNVAFNKEGNG